MLPFFVYIFVLMKMNFTLTVILSLLGFASRAQVDTMAAIGGSIVGTVVSKTFNAPLDGAIVIIASGAFSDTTITDSNGEYRMRPVLPGRYTMKGSFPGYQTVEIKDVIIKSDQSSYADLKLSKAIPDPAAKKKKVKLKRVDE